MKSAVIVIDVLNDFITGSLACERGQKMVPNVVKLVDFARSTKIPVIFCNDAHNENADYELKVWGPHALKGTPGAQVIPELKADPKTDYIVPKTCYSGFYQTNLDSILEKLGIDTLIVVGLQTHICVQHFAADAFYRGYQIIIPTDCVESFTEEDKLTSLKYIAQMYGAKLTTSEELMKI